nr:unnamed protein product [Spirometra erinaceieuropaei]
MFPRRGDAICTSRRCDLRHLAAWAERVITRRQIDVSVNGVGVRHPRLQQLSPCLVAGSRQYPRVGENELMPFLERDGDIVQQVPVSRPRVQTDPIFPRRKAKECVGFHGTVFSAGSQEEQAIVTEAIETIGTQHSSPGSMACADAGVEVTKDNIFIHQQCH